MIEFNVPLDTQAIDFSWTVLTVYAQCTFYITMYEFSDRGLGTSGPHLPLGYAPAVECNWRDCCRLSVSK